MSRPKKVMLGVLIFLVIVVVALLILFPLLLHVDRYRPQVAAFIQQQTGKPVEIGHLALTLFPRLTIRVDDFALKNSAPFPAGYFVRTHRMDAVIDARALWHHQVVIASLDLETPVLSLLSDLQGRWNSENHPAPDPPGDKPLFTLDVISHVKISKGAVTVAKVLPSGQPAPAFLAADGVSGQLRQIHMSAVGAFVSPPAAPGQGNELVAEGTLKVDSLRVASLLLGDLQTQLRLFSQQVFFDGLTLKCYDGSAAGRLSFLLAGARPRYSANAQLSGVNLTKLLDAFPDARGKMTGTLQGAAQLEGEMIESPDPLAAVQGSGQLVVRHGRLPGLQWNQNLLQLARQAKMGPVSGDPSSFSSIAVEFAIANHRINTSKVTIVGNGVDVVGSGSLALAGEGSLDYQGVANVAAAQNALTNMLGGLAGTTLKGGKMAFPFSLAGTFKNPKFTLKSMGSGGAVGATNGSVEPGKQAPTPPR